MYLALLTALTGWGLFLGSPWTLVLAVLFVLYMNRYQIRPEEQALEAAFGEKFLQYKRRVRRWI
jgi:protein-S-isoprenylcysteine O-methyltransferase Ste14